MAEEDFCQFCGAKLIDNREISERTCRDCRDNVLQCLSPDNNLL